MKIFDMFAGLRGWSDTFKQRGHETFTLDNDKMFNSDLTIDVLKFDRSMLPWTPDVILASPPCHPFSVMNIGKNFTPPRKDLEAKIRKFEKKLSATTESHSDTKKVSKWTEELVRFKSQLSLPEHHPITETSRLGMEIVAATIRIIREIGPTFFVMENPRAKLRKLPMMLEFRRETVWYCRYGEKRAKPTDLWGGFPPSWEPQPQCNNGNPDHVAAVRGSTTGSQGMSSADSAKVPAALSLELCLAMEKDFDSCQAIAGFL